MEFPEIFFHLYIIQDANETKSNKKKVEIFLSNLFYRNGEIIIFFSDHSIPWVLCKSRIQCLFLMNDNLRDENDRKIATKKYNSEKNLFLVSKVLN